MRRSTIVLCALAAACVTYAEPPENYELSWAKRGVAFEAFAADVDACNTHALGAADAVPPYRGDPTFDELGPVIWFWRWLVEGVQVSTMMAQAYDACMRPRGYFLIYVAEEEARVFMNLPFVASDPNQPLQQRLARIRDAQLRHLYRLAVAPRPLRARIEPRYQSRSLLAFVRPAGAQSVN